MRIGKQDQAYTAMATSDAEGVTVRGLDLCSELIGKIDFTDYFWLLVLGERPSREQRAMMDACLVNLHLAESFVESSMDALRIHGGKGYMTETEVERDLRDAIGTTIYAGTSDIQRNIVAKLLET